MSGSLRADADLRGFVYAPEPLAQRCQWQLDAAQAQLGKLQRRITEVRQQQHEHEQRHLAQSRQAGRDWQAQRNPMAYRASLLYLAQLQAAIEADRRLLQELGQQRDDARAGCRQLQSRIDGFAKDRAQQEEAHAAEVARRAAAEADRDWNARRPWHVQMRMPAPAIEGGAA